MTDEQQVSVADMLRTTGENTQNFMIQIAQHIEKLEAEVLRLQQRVTELESTEQHDPE